MLNMDFLSIGRKIDTIVRNPPYVRYQDILPKTKLKLLSSFFDERSNLYLFFIEKCIKHLNEKGELIFITPRDFLKSTANIKLNKFIFDNGTITDLIDFGDKNIFLVLVQIVLFSDLKKEISVEKLIFIKNLFCQMDSYYL